MVPSVLMLPHYLKALRLRKQSFCYPWARIIPYRQKTYNTSVFFIEALEQHFLHGSFCFVTGMLRGDSVGALAYWVGGNDMDTESGWRWTDGQPFAYFNWNDGKSA